MISIKKILHSNELLKVFSFTGLSTLIKLLTSYITVKVVASIVGPSGIAIIGQLQNFVSIITTLGAGGINNGVVKYVSEYKDDTSFIKKIIGNGFRITVLFSSVVGGLVLFMSFFLSKWILLDSELYYVFMFLGLSLILMSINNFFISILNGYKEFKKYVIVNIITSVVGLFFTLILVYFLHLPGALIANVTYQSVILFVTIYFVRKSVWFNQIYLWNKFDINIVKNFLSYSLMALVTAATAPVSQLFIRGYLIKKYSITAAGYWDAMNRISGLYLLFVTTSLGVYYLPKLSEIKSEKLLKNEVLKTYRLVLPIVFLSLIIMYFLKDFIISILFTKEFYPVKNLFSWQFLGDFFKIASWILAFIMVAKSKTKAFIITEIVFSLSIILLSYYFINFNGVVGATQAYFVNYFLYFIIMLIYFRKLLLKTS
ncbi:O-antigen translocase [Empedobacter sp.]|uniref:O-antigen translocase n=1 Tax=Empedobacter sp. TaxID=1927715 RepID=UPI0028A2B1DB|nr:O-antigen translocase [Empedobacter sp.]